jgi:hypothetical protein
MTAFHVWLRPLQGASRLRVEGMANALWLLQRLSQSFYFKSSEPVHEVSDTSCTFEVLFGCDTSSTALSKVLARIPEVRLLREPA